MQFSVCLDALYGGQDTAGAMRQIARLGYAAYEFWDWRNKDLDRMLRVQQETGLAPAAFCTVDANLVDEGKRDIYMDGLRRSIEVAHRLGAKMLILTVGDDLPGIGRERQRQSIVDGLRASLPLLEQSEITLVMEPLNQINHKGYFLTSSDEAFDMLKQLDHPRLKLLFDIYHQQITEGDIIRRMTQNIQWIGHIHAAGNPGRHELDTGELNYPAIFAALDAAGYRGYIGLEYFPERPVEQGLAALMAAKA